MLARVTAKMSVIVFLRRSVYCYLESSASYLGSYCCRSPTISHLNDRSHCSERNCWLFRRSIRQVDTCATFLTACYCCLRWRNWNQTSSNVLFCLRRCACISDFSSPL